VSNGSRARSESAMESRAIKIAALAVVMAALYYGKPMLAPLALAVLLSLLLTPPVHFLERYIGRLAAVIVSVVLTIVILSTAGYGLGVKAVQLASRIPQSKDKLIKKADRFKSYAGVWVSAAVDGFAELTQNKVAQDPDAVVPPPALPPPPVKVESLATKINPFELTASILGPLLGPLETALIVLIFSIYILIQPDDLRNRIVRLAGRKKIRSTSHAVDEVSRKVSHYIFMQTVINFVYGAMVAAGMSAMGLSDGIVWGGLVAILRFVPYLGTWLAALPPILLLIATTDGWQPLHLLMLFVILDLGFAFVIEPNVIGSGFGISPLSLLVAAIFWTWMWGPLGLLLSTPLTVCLAVMGKHISALRFLNVLLTDKPVLNARVRFYHRLIAQNRSTALALLKSELRDKTHCQLCDSMLLPVVGLSEMDQHYGRIDAKKAQSVRELAVEVIDAATKSEDEPSTVPNVSVSSLKVLPEFTVLCIPAHTSADELTARIFAEQLRARGIHAHEMTNNCSLDETLAIIAERRAEIVCISATPPNAVLQARTLYQTIRAQFPNCIIVIGLWARRSSSKESRLRIESAKSDGIVSTYAEGIAFIERQIPALIRKYKPLVQEKK